MTGEPMLAPSCASNPRSMHTLAIGLLALSLGSAGACTPRTHAAPGTHAATDAASSASVAAGKPTAIDGPAAASASASPSASAMPPTRGGAPCGKLGCTLFDSPAAALHAVLAGTPRVLAVGEAHAQRGTEGIPSATRRFDALLPDLRARARDLVLELWVGRTDCVAAERKVREKQKPVTAPQAETNQNEFVELAQHAKDLGVAPHVLRGTCKDYDDILRAGDDAVGVMLEKIATITAQDVSKLLELRTSPNDMIVTYGGALHNDLAPPPGRESMSFGPALDRATGGKYVELDLIVPEYIKDTDVWRALEWYSAYDRARFGDKTVLFEPQPRSFVLVFPMTRKRSN